MFDAIIKFYQEHKETIDNLLSGGLPAILFGVIGVVWWWYQNHRKKRISYHDQAVELQLDFHEVWYNRGNALLNLDRWQQAIDSYNKALEIKPDEPSIFYNKASCYALQNNADLAIQNLEQAINLNTDEYQKMAKTDTNFDSIRNDARFQALIQE